MFSPVAVAGCAINLLVALILIYMRFGRSGRDWLDLFAIAHGASAAAYLLLIPFDQGGSITAYLSGAWSLPHSFFRIVAAATALCGMLRLVYGVPPWRTSFLLILLGCAGAFAIAFFVSHYASFRAIIISPPCASCSWRYWPGAGRQHSTAFSASAGSCAG